MKFFIQMATVMLVGRHMTSAYCPPYCQCGIHNNLPHVQCIGKGLISVELDVPPSVQLLELSYNSIYELRDNIFEDLGLENIIQLYLDNNAIQSVGLNAFVGLPHLQILDLSGNHLYNILPGTFETNHLLVNLNLQGNPLRYLPGNRPFLISSSIESLDISDCRLSYIPRLSLVHVPFLVSLNLSHNHLLTMNSDALEVLYHLKEIDISNNNIGCDSTTENFITWLDSKSIQLFGSPCTKKSISSTKDIEKKMEKMVVHERFEDSSVEEFDYDRQREDTKDICDCTNRKWTTTVMPVEEVRGSANRTVNPLFLVVAFINGLIVGVAGSLSFWVCFRWMKTERRNTTVHYEYVREDAPPAYSEIYS